MQLPYDLVMDTYIPPKVKLCETNKKTICELHAVDLNGTFKFNSYSEISFEVPRVLLDTISGETYVHPFYDKIEGLRLVYLDGFGYFELQNPSIFGDGIQESKSINAFSLEYTLSQKYLVNFIINTPDVEGNIGGGDPSSDIVDDLVMFYNPNDTSHSLLHLALQKARGWSIGHVDESLKMQSRSFNITRESIYDFFMNDVTETFKCYFVFDTIDNLINVYAESASEKFYGDGVTKTFTISPAFTDLGDVIVDGYRTVEYSYDTQSGVIEFNNAPAKGVIIEVNDGSQKEWQTDIFVSFENIASEMEISYEADNIKTCLTVSGEDDLDISDVNLGSNYIMDLSYYHTRDWMGNDLYEAYGKYLSLLNDKTPEYTNLLEQYNNLYLEYSELQNRITTDTTEPTPKINLNDVKLEDFHNMLRKYYKDRNIDGNFPDSDLNIQEVIKEDFSFISSEIDEYITILQSNPTIEVAEQATMDILSIIWKEYGIFLLEIRVDSYKGNQQTHIESEWSNPDSDEYYMYWANYMMLSSCEEALKQREDEANEKVKSMEEISKRMAIIAEETSMDNNFTDAQLTQLSAFIREDEYSDSNFIITEIDTIGDIFKTKKELLQCGKIELSKICKPTLAFNAKLANIYALPEFAPIIHQFQLGKLINISLRQGYIKKARLMEVQLNFDDLSDFNCVFGDLISAKSQIDIHADLLSQAAQAGKSVAANEAKWQKSSDLATEVDMKIKNGLIDANTSIKSATNQAMEWDQFGLFMRKYTDETCSAYEPEQACFLNNKLIFTNNNWKTAKTGIGNFVVDGEARYGVIADYILGGYIEGTTIKGSDIIGSNTIKIGYNPEEDNYNFEVDENGIVRFRGEEGGEYIDADAIGVKVDSLDSAMTSLSTKVQSLENDFNALAEYRIEIYSNAPNVFTTTEQSANLNCIIYKNNVDITNTLNARNFSWLRVSGSETEDTTWNSNHIGVKQITTTYADIGETASGCNFNCVVKVSDSIILESGQMPFINMIDVNTLKAQVKTLQTTVVSLEERIQALESA